ncbi:MAG: hypothetical protein KDC61_00115 [Saprospiraceae bacterium]|nr:hypothetical protein [Saprospiraceae bacterium]
MPFSPKFRRQLTSELQVKHEISFEMATAVIEWFSRKSKDANSLRSDCTKIIEKVLAERSWVEALRRADTEAWEKLYRNCYHQTASLLRGKGAAADEEGASSGVECRDIFQQAVVDFWKKLQKHDFFLFTSVQAYVNKISLHHLYNAFRVRKKLPPMLSWEEFISDIKSKLDDPDVQESDAFGTVKWSAEDEHRLFPDLHRTGLPVENRVMECFGKIKNDRFRDVLHFKYFENWSHEKIAEHLKTSIGNSRQLLDRARKQIRRCLENSTLVSDY